MEEIRVLSPTAILGYGYPQSSYARGIAKKPHVIAVDAGSTDPGPYYLGSGKSFTLRAAVKKDLVPMLKSAQELDIPVIIGTAGGSGAKPHVDWNLEIIEEILAEEQLQLPVTVLYTDVPEKVVLEALALGQITPCGPAGELTEEAVRETPYMVAQIGADPIIKVLKGGAQVILAGRAYDPCVFAALPMKEGFPPGLALHMGKILECAAIASTPGSGSDCMFGTLYQDSFVLETLSDKRECTTLSVSAHTLYEKSDPYHLPGPGGSLDLTETTFTAMPDGKVRVAGTRYVKAPEYTLKLEGARKIGYRTISIAGIRDPIMLANLEDILSEVKTQAQENYGEDFHLHFHCYGKNGVMGTLEFAPFTCHEVGLVIDCVAKTQLLADTVCGVTRSTLLHYGYPGRKSTAGNLAFPYSPSDFSQGAVYAFSVHHLLPVEDPNSFVHVVERGQR